MTSTQKLKSMIFLLNGHRELSIEPSMDDIKFSVLDNFQFENRDVYIIHVSGIFGMSGIRKKVVIFLFNRPPLKSAVNWTFDARFWARILENRYLWTLKAFWHFRPVTTRTQRKQLISSLSKSPHLVKCFQQRLWWKNWTMWFERKVSFNILRNQNFLLFLACGCHRTKFSNKNSVKFFASPWFLENRNSKKVLLKNRSNFNSSDLESTFKELIRKFLRVFGNLKKTGKNLQNIPEKNEFIQLAQKR